MNLVNPKKISLQKNLERKQCSGYWYEKLDILVCNQKSDKGDTINLFTN